MGQSSSMVRASTFCQAYSRAVGRVMLETVWPTRCIICEKPGEVMCRSCLHKLCFIDQTCSCPKCGAPFGVNQCTECGKFPLRDTGRATIPMKRCVNACEFDSISSRVVTAYKDAGERRVVDIMAYYLVSAIPPQWVVGSNAIDAVVAIPASPSAARRRGFDHGAEMGANVARMLNLPILPALSAPKSHDQRVLSRKQRVRNMKGTFDIRADVEGLTLLLVDDVYTTGATLFSASDVLSDAHAKAVYAATFARVY